MRIFWHELAELAAEAEWAGRHDLWNLGCFSSRFAEQSLRGIFEGYFFGSGLRVLLVDLLMDHDIEIMALEPGPMAGFGLAIGGRCVRIFKDGRGRTNEMGLREGFNVAGGHNAESTSLKLAGGERHRMVNVRIKRSSVPALMADWDAPTSEPISQILLPSGPAAISFEKAISLPLASAVHQILQCSHRGPARRLFMQSKGLEILAYQLQEFSTHVSEPRANRGWAEVEPLHEARMILRNEFADPPALLALARRVGINDFKLKRGFRDVFGTTVFGYVRQLRMEKARLLLETSDLSVTEIALSVGYTSLGHFACAFKRSFGLVPREYRRARERHGGLMITEPSPNHKPGTGRY